VRAVGGLIVAGVSAVALAVAVAGCGTGGLPRTQGDLQNGAKLFQDKCGGCHKLAAAGTQGTAGPSLDGAFAFAYDKKSDQPFKRSTIQSVVLDQIRDASPPMPKDLVEGQDAVDVAAYVATNAGVNGAEAKPAGTKSTDGKTIFSTNCASCHTLAAAGASGTIGPNLDQLKPPQPIVKHQVEVGGGVMPAFKGKLNDEQIDAVAKYVAQNAGK
jgi:cbb3-type cytochrome c oxidase subunit III